MKNRTPKVGQMKFQTKEGWDMLLKGREMKKRSEMNRASQRHMSAGIGHHLARMMKGHI